MFDLNEQIKKWRDNLVKQQALKKSDIDELESHLRDEIDELRSTKLSPEEVFAIAINRLGYIDSIVDEYAKINQGKFKFNKVVQIISGIFFYLVSLFFAKHAVAYCVQIAIDNNISDYSTLALISFAIELQFVIGIFLGGCLMYKCLNKYTFLKMFIKQISGRAVLLTGLFWLIIYRIGFQVPIPAFRGMNFQPEFGHSLKILKLFILISILCIFICVTGLKNSEPKATES